MAVEPIKASLVTDLVSLINENLGALLHVQIVTCPDCMGRGISFNRVADEEQTCATCGGAAAIERYDINRERLQQPQYGRLIEQIEYKNGQYVPKFRSKDKAFQQLVRMLGYEKAIVEIANAAPLSQTLSDEQRAAYVEQLKELAAMGLLDGNG
jgi:hypothetical protein